MILSKVDEIAFVERGVQRLSCLPQHVFQVVTPLPRLHEWTRFLACGLRTKSFLNLIYAVRLIFPWCKFRLHV
jgi:hypothetical protein